MNIGTLLTKSAKTYPNNLAIAHGALAWTFAQFNARVNRLANALYKLGIRQGDNIALLQSNTPQMLEAMFAGFKCGCAVVPINWRLHPREFSFIINHSAAKAVILSNEFNGSVMGVRNCIPNARHLITIADAGGELLDYETLLLAGSDEFAEADVYPNDLAWLFYTSGTTGMPKGAMLSHRNLLAMTMNFYADICPGLGPEDVVLHAAPLSHGSGCYALPNIAKGAANIILASKSFEPERVFKTIEKHRVTNMFAAPTMVKLLIESPAIDHWDLSSLKALNYGGGPMLAEDLKVAIKKLGPCLVQLFGQAESPMTITYLPHRDHVMDGSQDQLRRLSSAGIPRTDVEVKIFDTMDRELPAGEIGQIVTRSDMVMKGYWKNPEATAETLKNGWLYTGDLGCLDERGYLFIMGRSKDMVISGGENIYPREIEEVLVKHPAVREVAVIGVPDPKWGEALKAVVSLVEGEKVSGAELISFCREYVAGYKKPRSIEFVGELPKNNYGKIVKRELRERYLSGNPQ